MSGAQGLALLGAGGSLALAWCWQLPLAGLVATLVGCAGALYGPPPPPARSAARSLAVMLLLAALGAPWMAEEPARLCLLAMLGGWACLATRLGRTRLSAPLAAALPLLLVAAGWRLGDPFAAADRWPQLGALLSLVPDSSLFLPRPGRAGTNDLIGGAATLAAWAALCLSFTGLRPPPPAG